MSNEHAYGVVYTPSSVNTPPDGHSIDTPSIDNDHLLTQLGIRFVRIQWLSLTNVVHFRILPRVYLTKLLESARPGVTLTKATLGLVGLTLADWHGFAPVGEHLYVPDVTSFRICTYAPGHASVMGFFEEKVPAPTFGLNVPTCPRSLLKRVLEDAEKNAGVQFLVGIESEFILLDRSDKTQPPAKQGVNAGDWSTSAKFPTGAVETKALDEMVVDLLDAGIEVHMYHAEAAPGQYEIVTGPMSPLQAADALVFTRETIRNVASKYGLRATFAPRLNSDSCGSGAHMHISVHSSSPSSPTSLSPTLLSSPTTSTLLSTPISPTTPTTTRRLDSPLAPTLTPTERSFLQGVLTHLPALCVLTLPTPASYARVLDGIWSGGTYVCWGTDNREAPVRLCGSKANSSGTKRGGGHHFELKSVDATSNPYVALAGVLGAGAHAIRRGEQLKTGDCRKPVALMNEEERVRAGVDGVARLPGSVSQARQNLKGDAVLGEVLGADFVEAYLAVNETLEKVLSTGEDAEQVETLLKYY